MDSRAERARTRPAARAPRRARAAGPAPRRRCWGQLGLAALLLALALAARPARAAGMSWDALNDAAAAGLASGARCVTGAAGGANATLAAGALDAASCAARGAVWTPSFASGAELRAASEAMLASAEAGGDHVLMLVAVAKGFGSPALPPGAVVGDLVACLRGAVNLLMLDVPAAGARALQQLGEPGAGTGWVGGPFAMPALLRLSPWLNQYEQRFPARARPGGRLQRRVVLSPAARGQAGAMMRAWRGRHAARRRLLAASSEALDVLFHSRHAVLEQELERQAQAAGRRRRLEDDLALSGLGSIVASTSGPGAALDWLAAEPGVAWLEPLVDMRTGNMDAALVTQAGIALSGADFGNKEALAPLWSVGVRGEGEVVATADTGVDLAHCFFADPDAALQGEVAVRVAALQEEQKADGGAHRVLRLYSAVVDGAVGGKGDHGTHVAGTLVGRPAPGQGSDLANQMKGVAHAARLAFFDLNQASNVLAPDLIVPPRDLVATLLQPAFDAGARVFSNSWGGNSNAYTAEAQAMDRFSFEHQDFIALFANGNQGFDEQGTVNTPATAKSVVSVGASLNADRSWALIKRTCPAPQRPGGCAASLSDSSSSGPTADGRLKPDVVAPGEFVGSSDATSGCGVTFLRGTSMSTPVVAGNAVLVRQFLREGRYPYGTKRPELGFVPMGALLKAVLVNGADLLAGSYGEAQLDATKPGTGQGFGRVNLANTVRVFGNTAARGATFLDGDMARMPTLSRAGAKAVYRLQVPAAAAGLGQALRVTLAWSDAPAALAARTAIVNDLDLTVTDPTGAVLLPNGGAAPDRLNTVESITVPPARVTPGEYLIEVSCNALNSAQPQPFALVVAGPIETSAGTVMDERGQQRAAFPPNTSLDVTLITGAVTGGLLVLVVLAVAFRRSEELRQLAASAAASNVAVAVGRATYSVRLAASAVRKSMRNPAAGTVGTGRGFPLQPSMDSSKAQQSANPLFYGAAPQASPPARGGVAGQLGRAPARPPPPASYAPPNSFY